MTTTAAHREITTTHDEGDAWTKPLSVYVYGHDLADDEARVLAQACLDEWATEYEYDIDSETPARPLVDRASRIWVSKVPSPPMSETKWVYDTSSVETPGAAAVIEFEVDEHLEPRCEIDGCDVKWSSLNPRLDPRRMCVGHAAVRNARESIIHALGSAHQAAEYAMGYPQERFDALGERSTLGTPSARRAYALSHADYTGKGVTASLTRAITELDEAEGNGFTLQPWHFAFGRWNHIPQPTYVESVDSLEALPVTAVVKGRFNLVAFRTSGKFWSYPGSVKRVSSADLFRDLGPRLEVLSGAN